MEQVNEWLRLAPKPRTLGPNEKWNVFLSYRSVSRPWVLNLYDVLRGLGHKVFLDQFALAPGDQLTRKLEDALTTSQAGVLVWSSLTRDSEWVRREYEAMERMATEKPGFRFVPVTLDSSPLPLFASGRIYLDFTNYPDGPNGGELLKLLYAVAGSPWSEEAARFADEQDEAASRAFAQIDAAVATIQPDRLVALFEANGTPWQASAALGCKAAEGLTKLDRNDEAIGMLEKIEPRFPRAIRPRQLHALALARRGKEGDLTAAQGILAELYYLGEHDPETLGIYGRTWMDRYAKSGDESDLRQSRDLYAEAFSMAEDDYYTGINAAAKSVLIGADKDLERAAEYARKVQQIVGTEPHPRNYWMTATSGEALLIQKRYEEAARLYDAAVGLARAEVASHQSTWTQACRLMVKLKPTDTERALIRQPFRHLPECERL